MPTISPAEIPIYRRNASIVRRPGPPV